MNLKKIVCVLFATMFTLIMSSTAFAQEVPESIAALQTESEIYGPGSYDENNYFEFTPSRERMSSAGDFYFNVTNKLQSDNFRISRGSVTVNINGSGQTNKMRVMIVEWGTSGILPQTATYTLNNTWQSYTFWGLHAGSVYYLVFEPIPGGKNVSGIGYINSSDFGGLA